MKDLIISHKTHLSFEKINDILEKIRDENSSKKIMINENKFNPSITSEIWIHTEFVGKKL